jgi:putative transposase
MLERHDGCEISVKRQCELLSISRSTAYYTPKPGCMFEVLIKTRIDRIYTEHPYYGYRRITAVLQKEGYTVNHKRVRRYMREMGIYVIYPGPNLSKRNKAHKVYPYLLRNLPITRANQVWGVDITYVSMPKGWMYLFVIIDWYSRCIIDYELSNTMETGFIIETLQRAFKKAIPEIINSDQGSQFTSNEYIDLLKENHVRISMDSKGRATDNAITERFFRNIKQEKLYIFEYSTPRELRSLINEYIHFYNFERPHQSLDYEYPYKLYTAA